MIVVDTNVVVYLLAGEGARADAAAALYRDDPHWAAPPLLISELRNVLAGSVRRGWVGRDDALGMLEDARLLLGDRLASPMSAAVLEAALDLEVSAYDAEFVVLARAIGAKLVTNDQKVLEAAPDVAVALVG